MDTNRAMFSGALVALSLTLSIGGGFGAAALASELALDEEATTNQAFVVARIEAAADNYVEWIETDWQQEPEVAIGVAATYPNKPLVSSEFIARHTPIEVFLAVAELDEEVPAELLRLLPADKEMPAMDHEARQALKQANSVSLAVLPDRSLDDPAERATKANSCSASFKNWVGDVFGDSTCGSQGTGGFWTSTSYPSDTYCTSGCTYKLGEYDKQFCSPSLSSCDIVTGKIHRKRIRLSNRQGNISMQENGHKAHFGAANCVGNGSFTFYFKRGNTTESRTINTNSMLHYYRGSWNPRPASAKNSVTYGQWKNGSPASGSSYVLNKTWLSGNAGSGDRAIMCLDADQQYSLSAIDCKGPNVSLCLGGNCTNACWHCVGGSC